MTNELKPSPFYNDMFSIVYQAFNNLYPDKKCEIYWEDEIRPEDGKEVYGLTDFGDDGVVSVFVSANIAVVDAVEILAHELAHVAVGIEHDHSETWENAFQAIYDEYHNILKQMYKWGSNQCD